MFYEHAHSWYQRKTLLAGQHTNSLTKNKAFLFLLLSSAILESLLMLRKQIKGNLPGWILTEIPLLFQVMKEHEETKEVSKRAQLLLRVETAALLLMDVRVVDLAKPKPK